MISTLKQFLDECRSELGVTTDIESRLLADPGHATDILLEASNISIDDLLGMYSKSLKLPIIDETSLNHYPIIDEANFSFLYSYNIFPRLMSENEIQLVTSNPFDEYVSKAIKLKSQKKVNIVLGFPGGINRAIERANDEKTSMSELHDEINEQEVSSRIDDVDKLKDLASEAPIVRMVNMLVANAIQSHASDIHIEPFDRSLRIRYRVDGLLREIDSPPVQSAAAIISRIKIMAKLDIAERRLPQDGRIKLQTHGHRVDLRVSTIPSMHGESVVIRILDKESLQLNFEDLGFDVENLTQFRQMIQRQQGIVLVTGPTGSGKTTTLYSAIAELNVMTQKIMTVEDPVEYQQEGIVQMQVKPDIGLGFAETLRSVVRQDPDIIMIGEMRDQQTARIAMQSSLTGHFVLSTLHTNDVGSSITRLLDIGIEPYLISSTVVGVVAQRLVRKLCQHCKQSYEPDVSLIEQYQLIKGERGSPVLFHAVGCEHCGGTGYRGRTVILEQLELTDDIRHEILNSADGTQLQKLACSHGMKTMREDGIKKALSGLTSLEEVIRVTQGQQ